MKQKAGSVRTWLIYSGPWVYLFSSTSFKNFKKERKKEERKGARKGRREGRREGRMKCGE